MKISKKDIKAIQEQSKQIIKAAENDLRIAKEVTRKANINILTAKAIIKNLGKE